ncbi:MAG: hypothetical protein ACOYT4_01110 [Nanoarchaeota archaeon]
MIIKKIFDNVFDEEVHSDFLKFGKGEFKNKYLSECKKQKDKWTLKTGPEFANFLVKECLSTLKNNIEIKGAIISTIDLRDDIKFKIENVKNFMGVKQFILSSTINPEEILRLINKYPRVFFALSFSTPEFELKIKAKPPKSAKPSTKAEEEPKTDFCILKTNNAKILKELFFDVDDFKEIKIKHTIKINEIIYPSNEKDPIKIRELSKRKGQIIRNIEIDGKNITKESNFVA